MLRRVSVYSSKQPKQESVKLHNYMMTNGQKCSQLSANCNIIYNLLLKILGC